MKKKFMVKPTMYLDITKKVGDPEAVNGMDFWWKKTLAAKKIIKGLLEDMDESCCCCGADDWPNGQVDVCHYHEALEFIK